MPNFSVICCVSKPDVFEECLLDSINICRGGYDIEIIPIINNDNRYSASNALNIGIDTCRSDIMIFAHQDIRFLYDWFGTLDKLVKKARMGNNWNCWYSIEIWKERYWSLGRFTEC